MNETVNKALQDYKDLLEQQLEEISKLYARDTDVGARRIRTRSTKLDRAGKVVRGAMLGRASE